MKKELLKKGESPVTLAEVKSHLRVSGDEFDDNLSLLLDAAVAQAERITGLTLRDSEWRLTGAFSTCLTTGLQPILSAEAKVDGRPTEATWLGDQVLLPLGTTGEEAELTVKTGFEEFPADLKAALLLMTGKLFENPADPVENLPKASTHILRNHTVWREAEEP